MVVGVILAGGNGQRLRPITEKIPKPAVEIKDNWRIIHHQLHDFKAIGIKDVYVLASDASKNLPSLIGDSWNGINIHYLFEGQPKGTLWALNNCIKNLNEDCIVRNGDITSDMNLKRMVKFAQSSNYDLVIALTKMRSPYGIVEFKDGTITSFVEKPLLDKYINAGAYYIKKEAYPFFNMEYDEKDIEKTVFPKLVEMKKAGAYVEDDVYWLSIDNLKDLEAAKSEYNNKIDTDFGYIKTLASTESYALNEVYVKADYPAYEKQASCNEAIKVLSGKGVLIRNGTSKERLSKGTVASISKGEAYQILAEENLLFNIYEARG